MEQIIMSALLTMDAQSFSHLVHSLSADSLMHHHRCCSLILSPAHFTHTLHYLKSLSFHHKTILIARYLLAILKQLTRAWDTITPTTTTTIGFSSSLRLRDLDAVLLLMLLCEVSQHNSEALEKTDSSKWIDALKHYTSSNMLALSGIGASGGATVSKYVDTAVRCRRFLEVTGSGEHGEREVAASAQTVVSLPSVQVSGEKSCVECVICKEQLSGTRDVCKLPCQHLFHWICVLPWLKNRNTCPCCRYQLPTDDLFGEIERLWKILLMKVRSLSDF